MTAYHTISFIYPDHGPIYFLFWMLVVIAFAIWRGVKE